MAKRARSIRYWLKLVAGNMAILFVLLCAVNFIAALGYDGRYFLEELIVPVSEKAGRASLTDQEKAQVIFREFARLKTRYVPYVEWSREPFRGETTTVADDGDRLHASTTTTPFGHVRFFGGSTIWGKGVDDDHTIPAYFDRFYPDDTAYNHGESGFVSRQSLARLVNLANQGERMDLVIFYDGCNDFFTLCRGDTAINSHSREQQFARRVRPPSMTRNVLIGALDEVIVWAMGRSGRVASTASRCQQDPAYARRVAHTVFNNWKIAKVVAESTGAEFHAVLQPQATVGRPNVSYIPDLRGRVHDRLDNYTLLYPMIQELIRAENADWLHDFTDAFDSDEQIYIDACHANERGNEIIATRLRAEIGDGWRRNTAMRPRPYAHSEVQGG